VIALVTRSLGLDVHQIPDVHRGQEAHAVDRGRHRARVAARVYCDSRPSSRSGGARRMVSPATTGRVTAIDRLARTLSLSASRRSLKHRRSLYRPGGRSRVWWKAKNESRCPSRCSRARAGRMGRLGPGGRDGVRLPRPRAGKLVTVEQAVRVPQADEWRLRRGPAEILCSGVPRSRLLRHPLLVVSKLE
jgi:hypothetical protein